MTFLLGRQAMFGQEPPIYFRSILATRCPSLARVHAMYLAPSPVPRTTKSYSDDVALGPSTVLERGASMVCVINLLFYSLALFANVSTTARVCTNCSGTPCRSCK